MAIRFLITCILISLYSCKAVNETKPIDEQTWKLGWRMIENSWSENFRLAELQFDSLLPLNKPLGNF